MLQAIWYRRSKEKVKRCMNGKHILYNITKITRKPFVVLDHIFYLNKIIKDDMVLLKSKSGVLFLLIWVQQYKNNCKLSIFIPV